MIYNMDGGGNSSGNGKEKGKGCYLSWRSCREGWTNERHLRFLNSIEASFVRAMFDNINYNYHYNNNNNINSSPSSTSDHLRLRLDRHIPDSSESTRDLPKLKRRPPPTTTTSTSPDAEEEEEEELRLRASKKNKGQHSGDQVVPQIEIIRRDNENDKDGKICC